MVIESKFISDFIPQHSPRTIIQKYNPNPNEPVQERIIICDLTGIIFQFMFAQDGRTPSYENPEIGVFKYQMYAGSLLDLFNRYITNALEEEYGKALIILYDLSEFIPIEKSRTQKKRNDSRKKTQEKTEHGVKLPYPEGFTMDKDDMFTLIDVERLRASGKVGRLAFYNLIKQGQKNGVWYRPVVLDMNEDGPLVWKSDQHNHYVESRWKSCFDTIPINQRDEIQDNIPCLLGEFDLRQYFYIHLLRSEKQHILIISKDGDQIPTSLMYLSLIEPTQWPASLVWKRPKSGKLGKDAYYDLLNLYRDLCLDPYPLGRKYPFTTNYKVKGLTKTQINELYHNERFMHVYAAEFYVLAMILCGNDTYHKFLISHNFGYEYIYNALRCCWYKFYPLWYEADIASAMKLFNCWLFHLIFHRESYTVDEFLDPMRRDLPRLLTTNEEIQKELDVQHLKKWTTSTVQEFHDAIEQVEFSFYYYKTTIKQWIIKPQRNNMINTTPSFSSVIFGNTIAAVAVPSPPSAPAPVAVAAASTTIARKRKQSRISTTKISSSSTTTPRTYKNPKHSLQTMFAEYSWDAEMSRLAMKRQEQIDSHLSRLDINSN